MVTKVDVDICWIHFKHIGLYIYIRAVSQLLDHNFLPLQRKGEQYGLCRLTKQ